jgi:hypothetical protein
VELPMVHQQLRNRSLEGDNWSAVDQSRVVVVGVGVESEVAESLRRKSLATPLPLMSATLPLQLGGTRIIYIRIVPASRSTKPAASIQVLGSRHPSMILL